MTLPSFNIINTIIPNNKQNERILIYGPSGSGKTTLAHLLILEYLRKYNTIIFLEGGVSNVNDSMSESYEKRCFIKIKRYTLSNGRLEDHIDDLNTYISDPLNKRNLKFTLFFIDDLSAILKGNTKLQIFLDQIFTTSRQAGYDIICILHKYKLNNPMMRQNATKIIITKRKTDDLEHFKNSEYLAPFKEYIKDFNAFPICINLLNDSQELFDDSIFKKQTIQNLFSRITLTDPDRLPRITRYKKDRLFKTIIDNNHQKTQTPKDESKLDTKNIIHGVNQTLNSKKIEIPKTESNNQNNIWKKILF